MGVAAAEVVEGEERARVAQLVDVRERDLGRGDRTLLCNLGDDAAEARSPCFDVTRRRRPAKPRDSSAVGWTLRKRL